MKKRLISFCAILLMAVATTTSAVASQCAISYGVSSNTTTKMNPPDTTKEVKPPFTSEADRPEIFDQVRLGMTEEGVVSSAGEPDRVEILSGDKVWAYEYTENRRFTPDFRGEILVRFNDHKVVKHVFNNQKGFDL